MINVSGIKQDKVTIDLADDPKGIRVIFSGDIDMADPGPLLDPFFESIHKEIMANSIKAAVLDFNALMFLNSSGIKSIAKWIMKLATLDSESKYQIIIVQNKDITWQTTSLPTLSFLVPGAVQVD